jgi:cytochrome c553
MKPATSSFVKFASLIVLVSASLAHANDAKPAVEADPAKGGNLYTNGDPSRGVLACVACHGAAGNSTITQNPKLAGQHAAYLKKQLYDFQGPNRNNAVMTGIAKALDDNDIRNLAAYLDQQKPAPGAARNKNTVELGKKIYRAGIAEKECPSLRRLPQPQRRWHPCAVCPGRRTASGLHRGSANQFPYWLTYEQCADDCDRQAALRRRDASGGRLHRGFEVSTAQANRADMRPRGGG